MKKVFKKLQRVNLCLFPMCQSMPNSLIFVRELYDYEQNKLYLEYISVFYKTESVITSEDVFL